MKHRHAIQIFDRKIPLPHSKPLRIAIGVLFVLFGVLGFLPILGYWMVPVGLLILSVDIARVRRWRRRMEVRLVPKWRRLVARWRAWRQGTPGQA